MWSTQSVEYFTPHSMPSLSICEFCHKIFFCYLWNNSEQWRKTIFGSIPSAIREHFDICRYKFVSPESLEKRRTNTNCPKEVFIGKVKSVNIFPKSIQRRGDNWHSLGQLLLHSNFVDEIITNKVSGGPSFSIVCVHWQRSCCSQ